MKRAIVGAVALGALAFVPHLADAETVAGRPGLARELLQGCLKTPSQKAAEQLASSVGATPYSDARRRRELKTSTFNSPEAATGEDQRTKVTVTGFVGWDLPGPGAGTLEYQEESSEIVWVDRTTGQSVTPVHTSVTRSCRIKAPVANARAIFEVYEDLTDRPYGFRVSADRRWVDAFMFEPDQFDVELSFVLRAPLAGLGPDAEAQDGRLVLSDGGPRFIRGVRPGVPTVRLSRAVLLTGLDQAATMSFFNMVIEPVVQRLAARGPEGLHP
ncbi:MAG: hypothetical protein JWQ29_1533 [Phenylobacterium sp.]|nr:hypothetical protein [Phenylobacterium sp.]